MIMIKKFVFITYIFTVIYFSNYINKERLQTVCIYLEIDTISPNTNITSYSLQVLMDIH